MVIWEFQDRSTEELNRILEIHEELKAMGLDVLDEGMLGEIRYELRERERREDEIIAKMDASNATT